MSATTIETLLAHHDIHQTVLRLARGIDRIDRALVADCFWPDATDDHGVFKGTASDFLDWVMDLLPVGFERTQHMITNVLIDIDGDAAHSEAYFLAYHRTVSDGAPRDFFAAGRYLDRFERRDGAWRIAHRHAVYDWTVEQAANDGAWTTPEMTELLERGRRDRTDASYRAGKAA